MSKTEAAYTILQESKRPMKLAEIVSAALERKMIITNGKTPNSTLGADLLLENRRREKRGAKPRFKKVGPGTWTINT